MLTEIHGHLLSMMTMIGIIMIVGMFIIYIDMGDGLQLTTVDFYILDTIYIQRLGW